MKIINTGFMTESWDILKEGKNARGVPDGTGPYKDSNQRKTSKTGKRKNSGIPCPFIANKKSKKSKKSKKNKTLKTEDYSQSEMELNDPKRDALDSSEDVQNTSTSNDPINDNELIEKIKSMIQEYKTTKDKSMLKPIAQEMAKFYAPEATKIVSRFENTRIKTTRGNYGKYMQILSGLEGLHRTAMVFALRDAGAGMGLDDAIRVISGQG